MKKAGEAGELAEALLTLVFCTMVTQGVILEALSQQGYLTKEQMERDGPLAVKKAGRLIRYLAPTPEKAKSWLEICQRGWREMDGASLLRRLGEE